ncbi:MAG: DUF1684 domain-containing protein [Candidatus Microbacterium phytovorans]|uniref:DUF1684 domain-containing protein n=1 Tax=Candidatus Microbacterium phytovorans TaxID=3121374 RepID=A0AAJ5W630_9MICO|nr:DUF1684 domain-containing protein [Microbacterium sp.]WEK14910.1 MAG: DUF1684 domain-containing protein [Microbacterium sp.]
MDDQHGDDRAWRENRDAAVWGAFGIASLAATHWLDGTPRTFDGLPGHWHAADGAAIGDLEGGTITLRPGEELHRGDLLLRGFARDGMIAVRALHPRAAAERGISTIDRFPYDPDAVLRGVYQPTPAGAVTTVSVDGHRSTAVRDGILAFEWEGALVSLAVDRMDDGSLFAVFADATSGAESHYFRQLRTAPPDADGTVVVDLNRATLPPCAFSDHYVCVLPAPSNRLGVPVRAGEALVR